jgi:hypothetical protein
MGFTVGIKEFTDHAFRNRVLVELLEKAFAVRVPMSVAVMGSGSS